MQQLRLSLSPTAAGSCALCIGRCGPQQQLLHSISLSAATTVTTLPLAFAGSSSRVCTAAFNLSLTVSCSSSSFHPACSRSSPRLRIQWQQLLQCSGLCSRAQLQQQHSPSASAGAISVCAAAALDFGLAVRCSDHCLSSACSCSSPQSCIQRQQHLLVQQQISASSPSVALVFAPAPPAAVAAPDLTFRGSSN